MVKASTKDVENKFKKIITKIFSENSKNSNNLNIKNIKDWEKNRENEPSNDFLVPLLINNF